MDSEDHWCGRAHCVGPQRVGEYENFRGQHPSAKAPNPVSNTEQWPRGDHVEFWLFSGGARSVFAFNAGGLQYDAKNLDHSWDSNWNLNVRPTPTGWEAIASIPLSTFQFAAGQPTNVRWFCTREISHREQPSNEVSYQGKPLYYRNFPIVFE